MKLRPPDPAVARAKLEQHAQKTLKRVEGIFLKVHRELYVRSDGRVGQKVLGVPALLLTVPGRVTGRPQTVALTYAEDEGDLVLVASNGGSDAAPQWLQNIVQHPDVDIQIGRNLEYRVAEIVHQTDRQYERLWRLVNASNRGRYYRYQMETKRPIPVVLLHPVGEARIPAP